LTNVYFVKPLNAILAGSDIDVELYS